MSIFDPTKPQSTDFINAFPALDQSDKGLLVTRIEALLSTALSATGRMRFVTGDIYLLDNADFITGQFVHINANTPARAEILDNLGNVSWAYGGTTDPITWVVQKMISAQGTFGTPLVAMTTPVLTPSGAGGTLSTGTYYYKITAVDNTGGESAGSPEASTAVTGPNGSVSVSWTTVTGAVSYRIYRGLTAGNENQYFTAAAPPYVDTGGGGSAGTPPTKNSAVQAQTVVGNVPNANLLGPLLSAITAADGTVVVGTAPGSGVGAQSVRAAATSANTGVKIPAYYSGAGAPNATLPAGSYQVGDLYYDTTNLIYYICTGAGSAAASVWKKVLFGGAVVDGDLVGPVVSSITAGDGTIVPGAGPTGAAPQSVRVNATSAVTGVKIPAIYFGAGAPAGGTLVAGSYVRGDQYVDTTNLIHYFCITNGSESTSVWRPTGQVLPIPAQTLAFNRFRMLQSMVRVHPSAGQSIPNITWNAIAWDVNDYNTDAMWSAGSNTRLTAPITGKYRLTAAVMIDTTVNFMVGFRKNGAGNIVAAQSGQGAGGPIYPPILPTTELSLVSNDFIEVYVWQASGGALTTTPTKVIGTLTCETMFFAMEYIGE